MDSYRRVNAASVRNVGLLTWCLLQDSCEISVRNRTLTFTRLRLIWPRHLTWSAHSLWRLMVKYSCLEKSVTIVWQFHDVMHARVQNNWKNSIAFLVMNGVKQGCILTPTLFSVMFPAMLFGTFSGLDNGISIWHCTDSFVFNLRRLQAKTKVKTDIVNEFLFADDCALNATAKANMQKGVDKFSMTCDNFGLTISTKKTSDAPASIWKTMSSPKEVVRKVHLPRQHLL